MIFVLARMFHFEGILNLFRYITFRSGAAVLTALVIALWLGPRFIKWLRTKQGKGQPIRSDGPASHLLTKKGTPTMGGLLILVSMTVSTLLWMDVTDGFTWACLFVTLGFGGIGFMDDYDKVVKRSAKGVSGRVRLAAEFIIAGLATWYIATRTGHTLYLPFLKDAGLYLGVGYILFGAFIVAGMGNAVNLTDGLDGLATMPVIIAALTLGVIAYLAGNIRFADYLGIHHVPGSGELAIFVGALIGACLGFLWFNAPPAAVFMGDTGSLALGGALGTVAVVTNHEIVLLLIGGLFVLETVSVIVQVVSFKTTGRRVFRMAPLHHHYEQLGLERIDRRHPLLDRVAGAGAGGPRDVEAAVITCAAWAGKTFGVFGLARTGRSVVAALAASGAQVAAWDDSEAARHAFAGPVTDLHAADLSGLAAMVVSPGVPHDAPLFRRAVAAGIPVIGDIELFAQARHGLPPHKVVGVTGTNGKSTTAALIHHILVTAGVPARLGGNIGAPILSEEPLPAGGVYVLELSSFQLELTYSLVSEVAVLLNITPDHLDRHGTMAAYAAAKARLFEMQIPADTAIIGQDDTFSRDIGDVAVARVVPISAAAVPDEGVGVVGGRLYLAGEDVGAQADWPALAGPHNAQNAAAAVAAARVLGVDRAVVLAALATYPGLPHRMERVREAGGVAFVNDSKATNPASAAPALAAFARVHWIAGGQAKTDELDACLPYLAHVRAAYLIGEAAPLFARLLDGRVPVVAADTLDRAVAQAAAAAEPGDTVLLSPACASYDQFSDFTARGAAFRRLVEAL